jgi:hypothetical protein
VFIDPFGYNETNADGEDFLAFMRRTIASGLFRVKFHRVNKKGANE